MEDEQFEFRDGELMRFNSETNDWESAEPKDKTYSAEVKSTGGETKIITTRIGKKKLLKCLVEAKIPWELKYKGSLGEMTLNILLKEHEETLSGFTQAKANKLKNCLEPFKDMVSISVKKMEDMGV